MSDLDLISVTERLEAVEAKRKVTLKTNLTQFVLKSLSSASSSAEPSTSPQKELQLQESTPSRRATGSTAKPKYQNPNGPETWSGRGASKPQWFLDALAEGYSKEDLLIK